MPACDTPCEGDLAAGFVVLLSDFDEDGIILRYVALVRFLLSRLKI